MSDLPGAFASILSALTTLPIWLLLGLAVACWVALFAPPTGGIDIEAFRHQWGPWMWIGAIAFSVLFIARAMEACLRAYWSHKATVAAHRPLRFVHLHHECWWHLTEQRNGASVSQVRTDIQVSNTSDHPIQIVKVHLVRPRADVWPASALTPGNVSSDGAAHYDIPAHGTARVWVHLIAHGSLARRGTPISLTIKLTDQYGEE